MSNPIHAVPGTGNQSVAQPPRPPGRRGSGRGRRRRGAEEIVVGEAEFTSYYGRPVVKAPPWEAPIPFYLFAGGVAAGSSLLGAGADLTGRPALRRNSRIVAAIGLVASMVALVADLGHPERFHHMLRVFKPTSPMSVGTWILTAYGPGAALAGAAEVAGALPLNLGPLGRLLHWAARPGGLAAALFAPAVGSYTAVLLTDTATPAWHDAHRELPFVFAGSVAAASGGVAMMLAPVGEAGPARTFAVVGSAVELAAQPVMEKSMGLSAETLHQGTPGMLMKASKVLTAAGAIGAATFARKSRLAAVLSGLALAAGSACCRFGIFEAGKASARDPKYTIIPQRERLRNRRTTTEQSRPNPA